MEKTIAKMMEVNNSTHIFLEDGYELVVCAFLNMFEELYDKV